MLRKSPRLPEFGMVWSRKDRRYWGPHYIWYWVPDPFVSSEDFAVFREGRGEWTYTVRCRALIPTHDAP